ncbi:MAG: MBL fold metallo-hydrolase [Gemmatimonadetes bacterium]|nr:MBL fold metallo-hydrolase [Gemmatimonadota bacterium]
MRLTFLGTGTSFGIPVVGCGCAVCRSTDPRDRRTRSGALVEDGERTLLIDAPPELRLQLLAAGVVRLDAVWLTHPHADHLHGLDDLRIFTVRSGRDLPLHLAEDHVSDVRSRFSYVFDGTEAPVGTSKPRLRLDPFVGDAPIDLPIGRVRPVAVPHGDMTVYGLRVGSLGYVTDGKRLPTEALKALAGVETLVLSALWWGDPHPTHFNIDEAVEAARVVGARRTYLTHLTHRVGHEELAERLPPDVQPAYDGLSVDL